MATKGQTAALLLCCTLSVGAVCSSCSRIVAPAGPKSSSGATNTLGLHTSHEEAIAMFSKIHEGMSFAEVSQVAPLSEHDLVATSHGGAQFVLRLGDYIIWMRFDRPQVPPDHLPTKEELKDCILNLPPELLTIPAASPDTRKRK